MSTRKTGRQNPPEITKEDAIEAGLDLISDGFDAEAGGEQASEAYQDLCMSLDLLQVKRLNTLIQLLQAAGV